MTEQNSVPPDEARQETSTFSEADWIAGFEAMGGDPDTNVEFAIHAAYEVIFSE